MDLPRPDALRWLVAQTAKLRSAHGDVIGVPELLQPTGRYFPDAFTNDAESVARLFARFCTYAPLSEKIDVRLRFVEADDASGGCGTGGCGSGACETEVRGLKDRVTSMGDGYVIDLPVGDVGSPTLLAATLARSVGALVLFEAEEVIEDGLLGAMSEVAAQVCGAGVLLACGAYVYGKSCGGVRVTQHTHLSVEEHAVLLAVQCQMHGFKPAEATANLDTTQREAFSEAWAWTASNDRLMGDLRTRPEILVDGVFEMDPVRGILQRLIGGRIFGRRAAPAPAAVPASVPRPKRERTADEERRLAEARALVEEAWGEGR